VALGAVEGLRGGRLRHARPVGEFRQRTRSRRVVVARLDGRREQVALRPGEQRNRPPGGVDSPEFGRGTGLPEALVQVGQAVARGRHLERRPAVPDLDRRFGDDPGDPGGGEEERFARRELDERAPVVGAERFDVRHAVRVDHGGDDRANVVGADLQHVVAGVRVRHRGEHAESPGCRRESAPIHVDSGSSTASFAVGIPIRGRPRGSVVAPALNSGR
jgi:hypothetical protein